MTSRKNKDEVGQRKYARDAKGRFAAKPIKPLPISMRTRVSRWEDDEDEGECHFECTKTYAEPLLEKFKRIQTKMNPKKDCKNLFEEAHNYLIECGGMISKVIDRSTNKPYGFLVRIPSSTNPDVIFMRFIKYNSHNSNTYFQKLNAIVSTLIRGERWLEKREERDEWIDDIPFEVYYHDANQYIVIDDFGLTSVIPNQKIHFVRGRALNEVEREGYLIDDNMMDYFKRFEQKAREYYKNNKKNKTFVALPFI